MVDDSTNKLIQEMEREFPQMTEEFKRICEEQYHLFLRKQHDYGPGNIAMGTQLTTESDKKLSLTGLVVRMNDKMNRLINLVIKNPNSASANESIYDSFMDISVYGIIAQIVKNGKWAK